jgi:Protein of unknown function (DUF2804)
MTHPLPRIPDALATEAGVPRFGTYEGGLDEVRLSALAEPYGLPLHRRLLHHKKWFYGFAATDEVAALCAVADLSYTANAFVLAVDLKGRQVLVDEGFLGVPKPLVHVGDRPNGGFAAHYRSPLGRFEVSRPSGDARYHWSTSLGLPVPFRAAPFKWQCDLLTAGGPPPLTVVAPVGGGGTVNVTQKWAGLQCFGALEHHGRRWNLDGGVGGFDYTHGYLARNTAWRWAFGCGRLADGSPIGFNLVEGFNETRDDVNENALWVDGQLYPLGRARFTFRRDDPLDAWTMETRDGALNLHFRPIAAHREHKDLVLVKSRFVQPVGLYEGTIKVGGRTLELSAVPGVAEDQDILW